MERQILVTQRCILDFFPSCTTACIQLEPPSVSETLRIDEKDFNIMLSFASEGPDDIFDSGITSPGSTFEHTFEDSGTYDYFCIVHPWMIGTVQVQ